MNNQENWRYYNHAIIPNCAPHEAPDVSVINDKSIWKNIGKKAVFARWTSDFDDEKYTDWWYLIQDNPIDLESMKKSHRRRIKKGLSNFDCIPIDPKLYADRMADITLKAWMQYPIQYRPTSTREELIEQYNTYTYLVLGCFNKDGMLCGFDCLEDRGNYWLLAQGKTDPEYEQGYELNAAVTYSEIQLLKEDILRGKYLTNGPRNTVHETNFNDDLCHYYGFRKAYCRLHMSYNPKFKWIISLAYPFRKALSKHKNIKLINYLCNILLMEEIARGQSR